MKRLAEPRPFSRGRDLDGLLGLVARTRAGPHGSHFLHPGGLQWLLRRLVNPDFEVHVWYEGDDLVAFVVLDGDHAMPHADPHRLDVLDALAWAEHRARLVGRTSIEISVWDDDGRVRAATDALGYVPAGTYGPELVYTLDREPLAPELPPGYRFIDFEPTMDDDYVEMHRDAWSTIAPSTYGRQQHHIVTSMRFFERGLVPVVVAPDGTLAAYCIGWYDPITRWTEIEPLGTRAAYRGLGLAHAVVREVIGRSYVRGARAVMVWGTNHNDPAFRLYMSSGMRPGRILREYRRTLPG